MSDTGKIIAHMLCTARQYPELRSKVFLPHGEQQLFFAARYLHLRHAKRRRDLGLRFALKISHGDESAVFFFQRGDSFFQRDTADKPVVTLLSMRKLEERLPQEMFMRVHRSYIVNLRKITEVSRLRIIFNKNIYIPVGDNYKERFTEYINKICVSS